MTVVSSHAFHQHSNFCELALIHHGYRDVFPHVGRDAKIRAPNGQDVHPLVTGTFGGSDFMHSMLGEASDHLSEASLQDLSKAVNKARGESQSNTNAGLRSLLMDIPGGEGESMSRDMDSITRASQPGQGGMDPSSMTPQQLHETLWKVLAFRDKGTYAGEVNAHFRLGSAMADLSHSPHARHSHEGDRGHHRPNPGTRGAAREDHQLALRLRTRDTRCVLDFCPVCMER